MDHVTQTEGDVRPMRESFEELNKELVSAIKNLSSVAREYSQRFISITPLSDGPVPIFAFSEIKEVTNRYRASRERHHKALRKMQEFRNSQHSWS